MNPDILDCALGWLELLAWFRRVYFFLRREVRLRFKLATGVGAAGLGKGACSKDVPQYGLYRRPHAPWCSYLETLKGITPHSCMPIISDAALTILTGSIAEQMIAPQHFQGFPQTHD